MDTSIDWWTCIDGLMDRQPKVFVPAGDLSQTVARRAFRRRSVKDARERCGPRGALSRSWGDPCGNFHMVARVARVARAENRLERDIRFLHQGALE